MMNLKYRIKNLTQRLRQYLAKWFPTYMKNQYFAQTKASIIAKTKKNNQVENEISFLADLLPQNAVVLDVGANRGDYVFVFEYSQKCSEIHAFEPIPELNQQLHNLFPKAKIHALAISDKVGKSIFKIPYIQERYFDTRGTLEDFVEQGQTGTRDIEVKITTLDAFCESIPAIDFIKIDIEGHEFSALKGATTTLQQKRPLFMIEIEQRHHKNIQIQEIVAYVEKYEYRCSYFDVNKKKFQDFRDFDVDIHQNISNFNDKSRYVNNFLFIPKEKCTDYESVLQGIEKNYAV